MLRTFDTPAPVTLAVEVLAGTVTVSAEETGETTVSVEGRGAQDVVVEQRGRQVVVAAPQRRKALFGGDGELVIDVTVPLASALTAKLGSAGLVASGRFGTARVKSGSGDVRLDHLTEEAVIETGSGDVTVHAADSHLRVKSGSGDVRVDRAGDTTAVSTGSGDVSIGSTRATAALRSGSGDIDVGKAHSGIAVNTASGDIDLRAVRRGSVQAKGVSGDLRIGVPPGIPVWTDITCVGGTITSTLDGAGEPEEGQDYIELRAKSVSGDIRLEQL